MKILTIFVLALFLLASCTKVELESAKEVPVPENKTSESKVDIAIDKITDIKDKIIKEETNQSETKVESFGDIV